MEQLLRRVYCFFDKVVLFNRTMLAILVCFNFCEVWNLEGSVVVHASRRIRHPDRHQNGASQGEVQHLFGTDNAQGQAR